MLVVFSSKGYENIIMFGDVAKQLIHLMGHSKTVPGALLANEIPAALTQLQKALAQTKTTSPSSNPSKDEQEEADVSLTHRAIPLIAMLEAAQKKGYNIMWDFY